MHNPDSYKPITLLCDGAPISIVRYLSYQTIQNAVSLFKRSSAIENIRGPSAVETNLIAGLKQGGFDFKESPPRELVTPWVGLLNDPVFALPWAIQAKKNGKITKLVAGPNLVVLPVDHDSIITDSVIDVVVTPSEWVSNLYKLFAPDLSDRIVEWASGVDDMYWCPGKSIKQFDFLIFNKINFCIKFFL